MKLDVPTLARLSPLMDEALELDDEQLAAWLSKISSNNADLVPVLRELLSRKASVQTSDFLQRGPEFTAPGAAAKLSDFTAGDAVGPYRLIRELGRGGMGEVWLAERADGALKRSVALKLPVLSLRRSVLIQRFERERDILSGLTHPNIARLYDAGFAEDGQPYLALEYVDGLTIIQYAEQQALDAAARVRLLRQVMEAVQHAHANLVIHRDLKPSNVIVTQDGNALLLDFGIAKLLEGEAQEAQETELTRIGGKALSLHYAAPEQIVGRPISIATDIWALGVLLYELTTGKRPFAASDRNVLERELLEGDPVRPSRCRSGCITSLPSGLAADLDTIILKALKKLPAERYPTVSAFADDLDRWLRGEPVMAQKDSAWYRGRKFVGRHRWAVVAACAALVALSGFTTSLDVQVRKVTRERDRADRLAQFMTDAFKVADPSEARSGRVTARELLDAATRNLDAGLTADPAMRARLVRTMGRAYSGLGALAQSETLLRKEYERARHDIGDDDPATLALGSELVRVISEKWQPVLAEDLARNILARQRTVLGIDSPDTAVSESHLATVLAALGRFDEAIPLRQHSLKIERQQPTTSNLDLLDEEANLAFDMMRSGKGDPRETERAYRQLIAECSAKLGAGNPKTLKATDGLATALAQQGRFADEEKALRKALDDGRRELGPEHPRVLGLMSNQAAALGEMGDFDRAEGVLHELIAISQRSEGAMSSRAALAKYNLACVAVHRGNRGAALDLLADALDHGLVPDAALGMEGEEDLAPLRGDPRFVALVATAKKRYGQHVADNGAKHP